jgi:hypothetical protein
MSQPSYYAKGATALRTDPKLVRIARRLGAFQDATSGASIYNPSKTDTKMRLLQKLTSSVNGSRTSVLAGVEFGNGEPSGAPAGKKKVFVQKNSLPSYKTWVYYNGEWT